MAWTNSNWRQESTWAGKLAKLDLYIAEVQNRISADVTKSGASRLNSPLNQLAESLQRQRESIASHAARESRGGVRRVRFYD